MKINNVPADVLLSQRLFTILYYPRPMGRDFYDVIFLFSLTKPNYLFLRKKMKLKEKNDIEEVKKKLLLTGKKLILKN